VFPFAVIHFECKIQELDYGKHRYDIYSSQSNTKLNAALMNTNVILVGLQNAPQNLLKLLTSTGTINI
jgi:hypothetical protein